MSPSSSSSESDHDDVFDEDMEALKRACMMTGSAQSDVDDSDCDSSGESSGSDEVDLLRRLQERFSMPSSSAAGDSPPPFVKPSSSRAPAESDDEDDLETLQSIRRRFNQYENDAKKERAEVFLQESETAVTDVTSGQETPNILFKNSKYAEEHADPVFSELHQAADGSCNLSVKALSYSQFPRSAQNIFDALKKNRALQRFMRRNLIGAEAKIEVNKELKERSKCLMDFQLTCKKKVGRILCQKDPRIRLVSKEQPRKYKSVKVQTTWKKVHALDLGPAENSHVSKYKMVMKRFPLSLTKQPWSNIEKEKLTKGLIQQYQEMLLLSAMNLESDFEGSANPDLMSALLSSGLEVTPEKLRSFLPRVNWDRLASMYLMERSGAECESRWLNCEDPLINHSPWTIMEEKKLLFIAQERGIYNWIDIAIALGTQRTPFQCLVRYQRSLNPHILNKDWMEEEDAKLREAVENFGDKNWQIVASHLEGRTGTQCSNRWRKSLIPDRRKVGRWSVDEDKRLKVAVMLFGAKNWNKIAQFAPGRTQVQCRERWLNCLDPSLNLEAWTEEEDAKLLAAIAEHGYSWSKVATCVPPRTDSQCRRRWKILLPHEVPLLQAARRVKRTVLISNFVDRESERPLIGPGDFTPVICSSASECVNSQRIVKKRSREEAGAENQRETFCDKQPKKSRGQSRSSFGKCTAEAGFVSSAETESADLCLVPGVDSNSIQSKNTKKTGEKASREGPQRKTQRKASCGNQPKRSRAKFRKPSVDNLTAEGMVDLSAESAHATCLVPVINSRPAENRSIKGTRKRMASDHQSNKSRSKSRSLIEENATAVDMVNSCVEIDPAELSIVPAINSDAPEDGSITRKRKRMTRDNQHKLSGAKSKCYLVNSSVADSMGVPSTETTPAELSSVAGVDSVAGENGSNNGLLDKAIRNLNLDPNFSEKTDREDDLLIYSAKVAPADVSLTPAVNSATSESGNIRRTTVELVSSRDCSQVRHPKNSLITDRIRMEEDKIMDSPVDILDADDVPLAIWLDSVAKKGLPRRKSADIGPIFLEKPRAKRNRSSTVSTINGDLDKVNNTTTMNEN